MEKVSGIYKIINKVNGKYYVGSSNNITGYKRVFGRWYNHKRELNRNIHKNKHLQNAWNKYGQNNFNFLIIESNISEHLLLNKEQEYLDIAKKEKDKCYNKTFIAGKVDMTEETRKKISLAGIGKQKGENNASYKNVPENIKTDMKIVWIKDGQYGLLKYSKNIGYGPGVCHRLIKYFQSDENAVLQRGINRKINCKEVRKLKFDRFDYRGEKSICCNKRVYIFKNLLTGEIFKGIRNTFFKKFDLNRNSVKNLIDGKQKHVKNWIFIKENDFIHSPESPQLQESAESHRVLDSDSAQLPSSQSTLIAS